MRQCVHPNGPCQLTIQSTNPFLFTMTVHAKRTENLSNMPEFEEANNPSNPALNYVPSTDAVKKPKTRRRSGGFKKELAPSSQDQMGEISPNEPAPKERLSGGQSRPAKAQKKAARPVKSTKDSTAESAAKSVEPAAEKASAHTEAQAAKAESPAQPSEATLAALARIEKRLQERRAERERKRAERKQASASKTSAAAAKQPTKKAAGKQHSSKQSTGLLAGLIGFIKKLFGSSAPSQPSRKPAHKKRSSTGASSGRPRSSQGRRPQGNSGRGRGRSGGGRSQNRSRKAKAQTSSDS
tara:strand:- start:4965 stop:5855 length:891 start_codon:yes stop_codon:yes gene_type:complete